MKRIMVIDDDPEQAELMALALGSLDRRVITYADPVRALAALHHESVDLLIADLSMPWLDGQEVIASARERWPQLPVILVSGYAHGAQIAAHAGIDFFAKPINDVVLRQAVCVTLADSDD